MDLLTQTDRHSVPGETTQRIVAPTMPAYDNLMPPNLHVVTEPVAELERLATPADYVGHHRKPETRLGRAWSLLRSLVGGAR